MVVSATCTTEKDYELIRKRHHGVLEQTAIPAYAPKVLGDYGSEQLFERFDHPFVSYDVSFVR